MAEEDSELVKFLRARNVTEDCINRLIEDKIDHSVINVMTDEQLTKYIPTYGDRIALRHFCQRQVSPNDNKNALIHRLRAKLAAHRESDDKDGTKEAVKRHAGNVFAQKKERRVEISLLQHHAGGKPKQVRSQRGGGTRHVKVDRETTMTELLSLGIELYFAGNNSPLGPKQSYKIEMWDYKMAPTVPSMTVGELYSLTKLRMLKFFVVISKLSSGEDGVGHLSVSSDDDNDVLDPDVTDCQSTVPNSEEETMCTDSTHYVNADTPTIQFRECRKRLLIPPASSHYFQSPVGSTASSRNMPSDQPCTSASEVNISGDHDGSETRCHTADRDSGLELQLGVFADDCMTDIVRKLSLSINRDGSKNIVNVDRADVLDGGFRAFSRKSFKPTHLLSVRFAGEDGHDTGGLTREFLRLAMARVNELPIFDGPAESRNITLHYGALSNGTYEVVGKIIAYSIVHGGPLPTYFSPVLYSLLSEGVHSVKCTVANVHEPLRSHLEKVSQTTSDVDYFTSLQPIMDVIETAGCMALAHKCCDRHQLIEGVVNFQLVTRVMTAVEQFKVGLATLGVLTAVQEHPASMLEAFTHKESILDALTVESLFAISYSAESGSNRYRQELRTVTHWRDFLQDMEETEQLRNLLVFATGLDTIPAVSFEPMPSIQFRHTEDLEEDDVTAGFPTANTCTNQLSIPVVSTYDEFLDHMVAAITMATTFSSR